MGVTGIVDISPAAPAFTARIYKFSRQTSSGPITRTKRGDAWRRIRQTTPGGTLALSGKVQQAGFPLPDNIKGASGTIVLQFNGSAKETLSVTVLAASLTLSENSEDIWDIALTCELTANPVLSGFNGTQAASVPNPAFDAGEVIEGISKSFDPDAIADQDARPYDLDGLTDTDAAEVTAISNIIGATVATRAAMKLRNAVFQRTDHWGGTVLVTFARTTVAEDIINQASHTTIDPRNLQSEAATAAINATPPTPTGASFKSRGTTTDELNDNNILHKTDWGLRDTRDDIELDGTDLTADPFLLEAKGHVTRVTAFATPDAAPAAPTPGAVFIDSFTQERIPGQEWVHTFLYGPRTTADEVLFPHQWTLSDPGDLDSEGEVAAIGSIPAVPAGFYNRGVTPHLLTSLGQILYVMKFGRRSTTQDVEMEHGGSEGTPFEGITTRTAAVISNTNTTAFIAAANFSTSVNFASVTAKRLNDDKALLIQATRDNPRIVLFEMRSPGEEPVRGYVDAFGLVRVYVRQIYQRANFWEYELAEQPLPLLRMRFGIRRRQTGEPIDMEWTLAGSTNNAAFLGLPAGTVTYRGINGQHNYTNGGPAEIFHEFEYLLIREGIGNFTGHILYGKANLGWHRTERNLSSISPGTWVRAIDLYELDNAFDSFALPQVNYSGVLA